MKKNTFHVRLYQGVQQIFKTVFFFSSYEAIDLISCVIRLFSDKKKVTKKSTKNKIKDKLKTESTNTLSFSTLDYKFYKKIQELHEQSESHIHVRFASFICSIESFIEIIDKPQVYDRRLSYQLRFLYKLYTEKKKKTNMYSNKTAIKQKKLL